MRNTIQKTQYRAYTCKSRENKVQIPPEEEYNKNMILQPGITLLMRQYILTERLKSCLSHGFHLAALIVSNGSFTPAQLLQRRSFVIHYPDLRLQNILQEEISFHFFYKLMGFGWLLVMSPASALNFGRSQCMCVLYACVLQ